MKKLKYILFFLILLFSPKVFAATYNVTSKVEAVPNFGGGSYGGYAKGIALPTYYNIGTRYNGQLAMIDFYLDSDDWDWHYNKTYTVTMNMATDDWRNNFMGPQVFNAQTNGNTTGSNLYVSNTFRFISYKQIKFNIKLGSSMAPYLKFRIYSTNTNTTNISGINNWNLSSITISDVSSTPTPPPVNPTPTASSGSNNQDIINNNNSNTENIIDNNTQNTTDIINNNNSNTQNIIDNQNDLLGNCNVNNYISLNVGSISASSGEWYKEYSIPSSQYSNLKKGNYYWGFTATSMAYTQPIKATLLIFYSDDTPYQEIDINTSQNTDYQVSFQIKSNNISNVLMRFLRPQGSSNTFSRSGNFTNIYIGQQSHPTDLSLNSQTCSSKIDETTNAINQQNDYLMDNSNPNLSDNDFLNTFNSVGFNDPLSYLLTLPTQLINKILSLSDNCSTINLGTLYGVMISLPCINLENILGSSVWNIIDVIFSVSLLVVIFKNLYDTFCNLLTMGAQKEAKEKFSMPTPMDFLSMILGGDR